MKRNLLRRLLWSLLILFILANLIAFMHAWKLTHFSDPSEIRTGAHLTTIEKLKIAFTGVNNPRPSNSKKPGRPYQTIRIKSNKDLECWLIKSDSAKGTGKSGSKMSATSLLVQVYS